VAGNDDIARHNRRQWDECAARGGRYSTPWLDLDVSMLRAYVEGRLDHLPRPWIYLYPPQVLRDVAGKDVLLLATGGGQQSAAFGLLGANVTVYDLSDGQLAADRVAARHYGYEVRTVQGDMRDLSALPSESFDLVYQEISLVFVPDVREVYRGVARVLRRGGTYRVAHGNPAVYLVDERSWDGRGYRIAGPYGEGRFDPQAADEAIEFRHLLSDIFNGLTEAGLMIRGVWEDPCHLHHDSLAAEGTYDHMTGWVALYFAITAERPRRGAWNPIVRRG